MNYHKALDHVIFGGFTRDEVFVISAYLMQYAKNEIEPTDRVLKVWMNETEINWVREFFNSDEGIRILNDSVLEPIEFLNKKRELNKKRYSPENKKRISRATPENLQSDSRECQHDMTLHDSTIHTNKNTSYSNNGEFPKYFLPVINEVMDIYNTVMKDTPMWSQIKMSNLTDKRKFKIKNLWDKGILNDNFKWEEYFFIVKNSDFHKDEKFGNIDGLFAEGIVVQILEGGHGAFTKLENKPDFYFRKSNGTVEFRKKVDGKLITANPNY